MLTLVVGASARIVHRIRGRSHKNHVCRIESDLSTMLQVRQLCHLCQLQLLRMQLQLLPRPWRSLATLISWGWTTSLRKVTLLCRYVVCLDTKLHNLSRWLIAAMTSHLKSWLECAEIVRLWTRSLPRCLAYKSMRVEDLRRVSMSELVCMSGYVVTANSSKCWNNAGALL